LYEFTIRDNLGVRGNDKMRVGILLVSLFLGIVGRTQTIHLQSINNYVTGGAYSTDFKDAFSFNSNPACLGTLNTICAGILAERKWLLKELGGYAFSMAVPILKSGIGLSLEHSGDLNYQEQGSELAYGKNLGVLEFGICFRYLHSKAAGYPGISFGSAGAGICFHLSEKLKTGWELEFPVFSIQTKTNPEKSPQIFRMGFGYEQTPELFISIQVEKSSGLPLNVISAIDYRYQDQFDFSFGVSSLGGALYFKAGWKKNGLCIQFYTLYESFPGFSPGIVFLWENKKRKG
jgi:hypothetical protein